jgi:organic radical activating enzyme
MSLGTSSSLRPRDLLASWWQILVGRIPLLSIEITRECPLSCPGCYAYGDTHLAGGVTLRDLSDFRDDGLVEGVIGLVKKHRPLHVSLVGGEPMMRRRELDRILPALSEMGIFTMVVTSGVIPIPEHWDGIARLRVAVSIDGLPEHHDIRRKPATYERILRNVTGRKINVHWVITKPMMERESYLEEYVFFWNSRPEVDHIWLSLYTPQIGESSPEMLSSEDRTHLAYTLPALRKSYPKLLINEGMAQTFIEPPANPQECLFSKMSVNYSADLKSRVEPCVFGGTPDCQQCGCAMSSALHWIKTIKVAGPVKIDHLVRGSVAIGAAVARLTPKAAEPERWKGSAAPMKTEDQLVQIS